MNYSETCSRSSRCSGEEPVSADLRLSPFTSRHGGIVSTARRIVRKRFALKATASVFGSAESKNCPDVTCDEEQVRCSQSDARSRPSRAEPGRAEQGQTGPGRAGLLGGCSRGTAAWNQAPSCWLLTPHTTRCNPFHSEKKHKWEPPPPLLHTCLCAWDPLLSSPLQTHSHQISASGDGCRIDFQNWTVTVYQPPTTNTHTRAHTH